MLDAGGDLFQLDERKQNCFHRLLTTSIKPRKQNEVDITNITYFLEYLGKRSKKMDDIIRGSLPQISDPIQTLIMNYLPLPYELINENQSVPPLLDLISILKMTEATNQESIDLQLNLVRLMLDHGANPNIPYKALNEYLKLIIS